MKKILAAVLLCIIFLVGCTKTTDSESLKKEIVPIEGFTNTEYNPETDNQYFWNGYGQATSVNDGYYLHDFLFLYYADKDKMDFQPVCSNPVCDHQNVDCDAYIDSAMYLQYYGGYLYYVLADEGKYLSVLYRKKLDGSVVEKVGELLESQVIPTITIHRGYAYFSTEEYGESVTFYRMKLEKSSKKEELFVYDKGVYPEIYNLQGYGDGVFFDTGYYQDTKFNNPTYNIYYYDTNEAAVKLVKEDVGGVYTAAEGNLYYFKDGGIYKYDTSSSEESLFYAIDEMVYLSYDGRYLYLNNMYSIDLEQTPADEHKLYVVDLQGKYIDTIELTEYECLYGDSDYLFQCMEEGYQFLDKKQIGTGKHEWIYKYMEYDNVMQFN